MENKEKLLKGLPNKTGIYIFKDKKGKALYIGKALNIKKRVKSYFTVGKDDFLTAKTAKMISKVDRVDFILVDSDFNTLLLEAKLIKLYKPKYNVSWKDDKHFLYIKITKEEFPKVLTSRREKGGVYFGPFPQAKTVRFVLKTLRKIFPFCSQKRITHRSCFYSHLGLCHPCPSYIVTLKGKKYQQAKQQYRSNITNIKTVLRGESLKVISALEKKMKKAVTLEKFEEATLLRDQIKKLEYITTQRISIREYFKDEVLLEDLKKIGLSKLKEILNKVSGLKVRKLTRIEAYDISNLQGGWATGSLIVFKNGRPEKDNYRRFRIRFDKKPNDVAMIKEVLLRRFNHPEWPFPNLIIVDGGKPQVSTATKILKEKKLKIPVIGLAKKLEKIIIPVSFLRFHPRAHFVKKRVPNFQVLRLDSDSSLLYLLKQLRDESHRFALKYHRLLYSKSLNLN